MELLEPRVIDVLTKTRIPALLKEGPAVVLERIARGGGATNWYFCTASQLETLAQRLRAGSLVSFYFDDRIRRASITPERRAEIEKVIADDGDAVVGVLGEDVLKIAAEIVVSSDDLTEFLGQVPAIVSVFYGAFPGRDDDGVHAITVTLPDSDGGVRGDPY